MQIVVEIAQDGSVRAFTHHRHPEVVIIDRREDEVGPLRDGQVEVEASEEKTRALLVEVGRETDPERFASAEEIALARRFFADEEGANPLEVDDDAHASRSEDGVYVEMWGYISHADLNNQREEG